MPRKSYSEEFKRDAVAMYEDTDGVSLNSVAHDLGVNRGSLAAWVKRYGTGKKPARLMPQLEPEKHRIQSGSDNSRSTTGFFNNSEISFAPRRSIWRKRWACDPLHVHLGPSHRVFAHTDVRRAEGAAIFL
ncbi:transposase [Corynebacterium timonense]|uniref:transposase n=1 Tax=Corynebacterium timonense TaxID=441500 RepID=UPI0009DAB3D3